MKLILTLLVRDEEDVLEQNICFHLNSGVDHILAIDNGSTDGTRKILDKYKALGVLSYREITDHTYEQDLWVSSMAEEAANLGADVIIHSDADEFWYAKEGLKNCIAEELTDILHVPVINYLPPTSWNDSGKNIFDNFKYIVSKTHPRPEELAKSISSDLLFYIYPPKIITNSTFTEIGYGNDTAISKKKIKYVLSRKIQIHHFPIRGYQHFKRKVINGGSAYANSPLKNPEVGWHWKKWYKIYKKGELKTEYNKLSRLGKIKELIRSGNIIKSAVPKRIKFAKYLFNLTRIGLLAKPSQEQTPAGRSIDHKHVSEYQNLNLLAKKVYDFLKTQNANVSLVKNENLLENRYYKKLKMLVYTDSRGLNIGKDPSGKFYTQKLQEKYDVELVVKPKKWTTIFDFIEYYEKSHMNYDIVVAHVGISGWSPRPISQVKRIFSQKRESILKLIPERLIKRYMLGHTGSKYEGEYTTNLYSLGMAKKYVIPRMNNIPNLIFITSNRFIQENKGNYFKDRPSNINLVEEYSDLFSESFFNVVDLSKWSNKEVSTNTYDGIHMTQRGSDYIFNELENTITKCVNSDSNILLGNLIGKNISDLQGRNFEIKKEETKNKPLFILGSGPSLSMIDVSKLKNCYTMGFNRSYIAFKDWGFEPTYYVGLDFIVNNDNKREYRRLIHGSTIKRYFFSRHELYESYLKNPKVSYVDVIDNPIQPNLDFEDKLHVGNSGLFGLQIAIGVLGFREIYLIGCDANYKEKVPGVKSIDGLYVAKTDNDINHFRKDYYGKGTVYNKPGNFRWHYPAWKAFYEEYVKSKYLGAKIYNCSLISKLDFFEYKDFKDITRHISGFQINRR